MANVKITALNNLASADVDDGDVFVIDDISETETKKVTIANVKSVVLDAGTASTSVTDGIKIAAGHSWFANLPNTTVADIHAISSSSTVTCIVAALLDDVG